MPKKLIHYSAEPLPLLSDFKDCSSQPFKEPTRMAKAKSWCWSFHWLMVTSETPSNSATSRSVKPA
jgi:hypothetical protein